MRSVFIIGACLSGAVIGRKLAEAGHSVTVADVRDHLGGNYHTRRDDDTQVMLQVYGPHIFNIDDADVSDYMTCFGRFMPYKNRVKITVHGSAFSLPVVLHTINQFFATTMRLVGRDLYEVFFKEYTIKQWGCHPNRLLASILKRLPVRFTYDYHYFHIDFRASWNRAIPK
jgi:UDP-galactopyranose mutase